MVRFFCLLGGLFCLGWRVAEGIWGLTRVLGAEVPGLKPLGYFGSLLRARLKPCPSGVGSSGTAEAVPFRSRPADAETAAGALEGDYGDSEPSSQHDGAGGVGCGR
jgi:hypothetical protein